MVTSRQRATSASLKPDDLVERAFAGRSKGRPVDDRSPVGDPADPLKGAARFVSPIRALQIKVWPLPRDFAVEGRTLTPEEVEADDARTALALRDLKSAYLAFSYDDQQKVGALVTGSRPVADWLRHRLRHGLYPEVVEDHAMRDVRCPQCDQTFKNTPLGHAELGNHVLDVHPEAA